MRQKNKFCFPTRRLSQTTLVSCISLYCFSSVYFAYGSCSHCISRSHKLRYRNSKMFFLFILPVSTANTFQVQYIQQGILEIDTTNARWMYKLSSNDSMMYSYYGVFETRNLAVLSFQYKVARFKFQTPILINGTAEVKLSGLHSLSVFSDEGIFIGVDFEVGKPKVKDIQSVGGYCEQGSSVSGNTLCLKL